MKTALVLIAHGSRSHASNAEVVALCQRLTSDGAAERVFPAFLELAEPSLSAAVADAVAEGYGRVLVLPFFLNSGRHVMRDVPALVDAARESHSSITIELLPHIGGTEAFLGAIQTIVAHHRNR